MKDAFKKNEQKDEAAKLPKSKAEVAEMLLDNELLEMISGGGSENVTYRYGKSNHFTGPNQQ